MLTSSISIKNLNININNKSIDLKNKYNKTLKQEFKDKSKKSNKNVKKEKINRKIETKSSNYIQNMSKSQSNMNITTSTNPALDKDDSHIKIKNIDKNDPFSKYKLVVNNIDD